MLLGADCGEVMWGIILALHWAPSNTDQLTGIKNHVPYRAWRNGPQSPKTPCSVSHTNIALTG